MKTRWVIIGIVSLVGLVLLGSGAAPLIFSELVYGCNIDRILASGEFEDVTNHPITQEYFSKYYLDSSHTSRASASQWGSGTVEYSAYYYTTDHGRSDAHLKITVDHCAIPTEFQFQCRDDQEIPWVLIDDKEGKLLEYLRDNNCFDTT